MNYSAKVKAVEALGERMGEQVKRVTQRLGQEAGKEGYTLAWLEQQVILARKEVGQMLLGG